MIRFFKEHKWFSFMLIGILLMISAIVNGEYFYGQTILASVCIIFSLLLDGANKK